MKSNYKRLGDYIHEVDVRNTDLSVTTLLGVSISKEFIPSIANTIGTDMSSYKVVKRRQFAYGPVTSRNGDKISIAILTSNDIAIISQAYTVFEVVDEKELLPEYLMMWFRRPEFDRYARFHSHGSAREIFDWYELCDVMLPIPSIERQREIVAEYETISKRIKNNEQIIAKLEETAQTLYRKMFVDGIDKENLPDGWRIGTILDLCEVKDGTHDSPLYVKNGFPLVTSTHLKGWSLDFDNTYSISEDDYIKINERSLVENRDILFSMIGTVGSISFVMYDNIKFAVKNMAIFKTSKNIKYSEYLLCFLRSSEMNIYVEGCIGGSTQNYVTLNTLRETPIVIPEINLINEFHRVSNKIVNTIWNITNENEKLTELQSLLLAKMGK